MKKLGRCQSCGVDTQGKSKCKLCIPVYRSRPKPTPKPKQNSWKKEKPIQMKSGAELLAGLNMTEYYQGNDMTERWQK